MEDLNISIPADFERGDRAYFEDANRVLFGTAVEADDEEVAFQLDIGSRVFAKTDSVPQSIQDIAQWHRPLALPLTKAGSRISLFGDDFGMPKRLYATVVEHVPRTKLVVWHEDDFEDVHTIYSVEDKDVSLEYYMREWELED